ncbi:MAG: shikimate dehydrogenase [Betaproteobacteria bacterium]
MTSSQAPTRCAVVGNPIEHSRSPAIHQQFAAQTGIALRYDRILSPLDGFTRTVREFFAAGGRGLNITVPFKLEAWELARAHLSRRATLAQAVNTLWTDQGALHGCNTDGVGLVQDLQRLAALNSDTRVLLIGAGGAARGVLGPLLDAGCARVHVINRTAMRAHELIAQHQKLAPVAPDKLTAGSLDDVGSPESWDLVINSSSSSLSGEAPAVAPHLYAKNAWAYDMMYAQHATPFMLQAQRDGAAQTSDGLGMLVGQAAESFYIWHGVRPDIAPVLASLRAALRSTH